MGKGSATMGNEFSHLDIAMARSRVATLQELEVTDHNKDLLKLRAKANGNFHLLLFHHRLRLGQATCR